MDNPVTLKLPLDQNNMTLNSTIRYKEINSSILNYFFKRVRIPYGTIDMYDYLLPVIKNK